MLTKCPIDPIECMPPKLCKPIWVLKMRMKLNIRQVLMNIRLKRTNQLQFFDQQDQFLVFETETKPCFSSVLISRIRLRLKYTQSTRLRPRQRLKYCQFHYRNQDSNRPCLYLENETETQYFGLKPKTNTETNKNILCLCE